MTARNNRPSSLLSNVVALSIVRIARTAVQFLITPVILMLLGPEQYGLVAFSMTLQMVFFVFDQALSPTVIREFGRMGHDSDTAQYRWNLFYTFERLSLVSAALIGIGVYSFAPFIADHWLNASTLPRESVLNSVRLIGVWLAVQWPTLFYTSCFTGIERQGNVSAITVVVLLLQTAVAITALYFWHADVTIYIAVQAIFMLLLTLTMRVYITRILPKPPTRPHFDTSFLHSMRQFIGGTFVIGITTVILTQSDKIIFAKWISLSDYSAYALAFAVAGQLSTIILSPLNISIQPLMAKTMKNPDAAGHIETYHLISQMIALVAFTSFGTIAFFVKPLLELWLGNDSTLISPISHIIPWIALGSALNAVSIMPAVTQLASGWIKLKLIINIILCVLFLPALYIMFPIYAMMTGPILWIVMNLVFILIEAPLVHRKFFKSEYIRWLTRDILLPGIVCIITFGLLVYLLPVTHNPWVGSAQAILSVAIVSAVLLVCLPLARNSIFETLWGVLVKAK